MNNDTSLDHLPDVKEGDRPANRTPVPRRSSERLRPVLVLPKLAFEDALTPAQSRWIERDTALSLLIKVPSQDWVEPLEDYLITRWHSRRLQFLVKSGSKGRRYASHGLTAFIEAIGACNTAISPHNINPQTRPTLLYSTHQIAPNYLTTDRPLPMCRRSKTFMAMERPRSGRCSHLPLGI